MSGRRPQSAKTTLSYPGPGAYEPRKSSARNWPAYSIGKSSKDIRSSKESLHNSSVMSLSAAPFPSTYSQYDALRRSTPAWGFTKSIRESIIKVKNTPGPGEYNTSSSVCERVKPSV